MKKIITYVTAIILLVFGAFTLFLSSSVIFDLFGIREKEGNYVVFVVWANFISSVLYILAAYGLLKLKKMAKISLGISLVVLALAFIGLFIHINMNGIYETKTISAMALRIILTLIFFVVSHFLMLKNKKGNIYRKYFRTRDVY